MKIRDILATKKVSVSLEVFPPKQSTAFDSVKTAVHKLCELNPSFMSVTYGAGGGIGWHTAEIAGFVQNECSVPALSHLTCLLSSKETIADTLAQLKAKGIENILALRGDIPPDSSFVPAGDFHYASELVEEIHKNGDFCVGGACYPEGHVESDHIDTDLDNLKCKVDAGVDFLTTQMFFDNDILYRFLYKARERGITVPIVAGIMPVTNAKQITRICKLSGTYLPQRFKAIVDRFGDKPDTMAQAGIAYATEQIIDLIANGVNAIHIYTMNKPEIAQGIMNNLSSIIND